MISCVLFDKKNRQGKIKTTQTKTNAKMNRDAVGTAAAAVTQLKSLRAHNNNNKINNIPRDT